MNKRVKKLWIEALRSGKYKQTQGRLRKGNSFCCLGVLCDLYAKESSIPPDYHQEQGDLPEEVCEWAGFDCLDSNPFIGKRSAASHNDGAENTPPKTFTQISNLIQRWL